MKKQEQQTEYKITSGNIDMVLTGQAMIIYRKGKLVAELDKDDGRDLMICMFDMMSGVQKQEEARLKKVMKGVKKPKTSKNKTK